ncbi:hypothetical protein SBA4_2310033 [Candidatus Sulfopaludibacter sp. SbA4]|nr:hypothetical protein SBA4_2310033 [Candidatus Sulfopaludibacter sp. SbA4]
MRQIADFYAWTLLPPGQWDVQLDYQEAFPRRAGRTFQHTNLTANRRVGYPGSNLRLRQSHYIIRMEDG